ncbi:conserved hypothetical protein [Candidatus Zixiibacteriota bacterium]|nr:conserved hypothetical protein [candidate division Zixibacteria bacterium]
MFSVGGRANWMLRNMTSKNFGYIKPASSVEEQREIQNKWEKWNNGEDVAEIQVKPESEEGITEIESMEALEALIQSLKPSDQKDQYIKDCLQNVYGLETLPKEKDSPARLCDPDNYTYGYLTLITGVKDKHEYEWWQEWWSANKDKLQWNSRKERFEVKKK